MATSESYIFMINHNGLFGRSPYISQKNDFCINYIFASRLSTKFKFNGSNLLTGDKLSYRCGICVSSEIGGRNWVVELTDMGFVF